MPAPSPWGTRPEGPPATKEKAMTGNRSTTSELQAIVRFRSHEGKLDEFKRLSAGAVPGLRRAPMDR